MSEKFDEKSKSLHEKMMDKKCSESASMKEIIDQERNPATKQSYRSVAIIKMAILGWSPKQISEYLGLTPQRVSTILNSKSGKDQVRIGQHEMFTKNPQQMFLDILPDAVNTAKRAMKIKKQPHLFVLMRRLSLWIVRLENRCKRLSMKEMPSENYLWL